jgi:hypothetical protein
MVAFLSVAVASCSYALALRIKNEDALPAALVPQQLGNRLARPGSGAVPR